MVTPWQFACLASHVVYRQYISCSRSLSALHLQHNTVFYLLVVGPSLCLILLVTVLAHRRCLCVDLTPCYTKFLYLDHQKLIFSMLIITKLAFCKTSKYQRAVESLVKVEIIRKLYLFCMQFTTIWNSLQNNCLFVLEYN